MSTPNTDLLYKTLDAVIAAEAAGTWDQNDWIHYDPNMCGTACCFAGHALLVEGGVPLTRMRSVDGSAPVWESYGIKMSDGVVPKPHISRVARERLGLDESQADRLFGADNTLADLKEIVDAIATEGASR